MPLVACGNLRAAALTGLRRVVLGQLVESTLRPALLLFLLLAALTWLRDFQPSAADAMSLAVLAALVALLIANILLRISRPADLTAQEPIYHHRAWFSAAWPLALTASLQVINQYTDVIMLGLFVPAHEIGIYRAAVLCAGVVPFSLHVVNAVAAPHIASLYAKGETPQLQQLLTRNAQVALLGALPVTIGLIFAGPHILQMLFGTPYGDGHLPLAILAAGQLFNAGMGSVGLLLNMTGHEKTTARGVASAALINILLNFALIPALDLNGAALASTASLVVWNVVLWHAVRRQLGLSSTALGSGTGGNST